MEYRGVISGFAAIFILILSIYSKDCIRSSQFKDRLFNILLYIILFGITLEMVNIYIEEFSLFSTNLLFFLKNLYYVVNCTVACGFAIYCMSFFYEDNKKIEKVIKQILVSYLIIVSIFIMNLFTKHMFYINNDRQVQASLSFCLYYGYLILYPIIAIFVGINNRKIISVEGASIITLFFLDVIGYFIFEKYYNIESFYILITLITYVIYLYLQNNRLTVDYVTRLSNRKLFINKLTTYISSKKDISIILISLDDFKLLNDTVGHKKGDIVLRLISEYLLGICSTKEVYRYNGDEYAIILENNERILTKYIVENIVARFKKEWELDNESIALSASIGVIQCPKQADTLKDTISLLEYIISKSKNSGKGQVIYCNNKIKDEIERKNKIIELLINEVKNKGFQVYYQPIYDKKQGKFTKAEALLRLKNTEMGVIYPSEFIPIAEEIGIISEIGYVVLEKTCIFLNKLSKDNIEIESISINFSPTQMVKESLVENVMGIIEEYNIDPLKICIEITENFMIEGRDKVVAKMKVLHEKGIKFYLDDFGTGYSNISRVMELPFDVIKIDKTLIDNCEEDSRCFHLLEGLTTAFEKSNMRVLVEGVETENQIKIIGQFCYYIQGFYYARPVCEDEVIKYFNGEILAI